MVKSIVYKILGIIILKKGLKRCKVNKSRVDDGRDHCLLILIVKHKVHAGAHDGRNCDPLTIV